MSRTSLSFTVRGGRPRPDQIILCATLQGPGSLSESEPRQYSSWRALPPGPRVEMRAMNGDAGMPGNRNILFLIIGALFVAVAVLGYNLYQEKKEPKGLQINVGPNGLKIENK
jgi:hypothetical protein